MFDKFTATLGIALEYQLPSVKPHLQLIDVEELDSYAKVISPDEDWLGTYAHTLFYNILSLICQIGEKTLKRYTMPAYVNRYIKHHQSTLL